MKTCLPVAFFSLKRQNSKHLTPIRYQLTTEPKMVAAAVGYNQVSVNSWLEACVCGYRLAPSSPLAPTFLPPTQKSANMNDNTHIPSTGMQRCTQKHVFQGTYCIHTQAYTHTHTTNLCPSITTVKWFNG